MPYPAIAEWQSKQFRKSGSRSFRFARPEASASQKRTFIRGSGGGYSSGHAGPARAVGPSDGVIALLRAPVDRHFVGHLDQRPSNKRRRARCSPRFCDFPL